MISNQLGMKFILKTENKCWSVNWDPVSAPKMTIAKFFLYFLAFFELKRWEKRFPINWAWNLSVKPKTSFWSVNWDPVSAPKKTVAKFFLDFLTFFELKSSQKWFAINWAWNLSLKLKQVFWMLTGTQFPVQKRPLRNFFSIFFLFLS